MKSWHLGIIVGLALVLDSAIAKRCISGSHLLSNGLELIPHAAGFYLVSGQNIQRYELPKLKLNYHPPGEMKPVQLKSGRPAFFGGNRVQRSTKDGRLFVWYGNELMQITHFDGDPTITREQLESNLKGGSDPLLVLVNSVAPEQESFVVKHPSVGNVYLSYFRKLPTRKKDSLIEYGRRHESMVFQEITGSRESAKKLWGQVAQNCKIKPKSPKRVISTALVR